LSNTESSNILNTILFTVIVNDACIWTSYETEGKPMYCLEFEDSLGWLKMCVM